MEDNKIVGVRMAVKCTQDEYATENVVRFKIRGDSFEVRHPSVTFTVILLIDFYFYFFLGEGGRPYRLFLTFNGYFICLLYQCYYRYLKMVGEKAEVLKQAPGAVLATAVVSLPAPSFAGTRFVHDLNPVAVSKDVVIDGSSKLDIRVTG